MNIPQKIQLAFCVSVLVTGPLAAPLIGGDEFRGPGFLVHQDPVVAAPVLPPDLSGTPTAVPPQFCGELRQAAPRAGGAGTCYGEPAVAAGVRFGASSQAFFGRQVANGQAASLVLYRYDFLPGSEVLAPAGHRKLKQQARVLVETPFPLIIEPAGRDRALDDARRREVLEILASLPYPVPPERVVVAPPPARGMSGMEAEGVYLKFLDMVGGGEAVEAAPVLAPPPAFR